MPPPRFVDPDRFVLLAGVVDWLAESRRFGRGVSATMIAERRRIKTRVAQLRWTLSPQVGLPTEPFKVWRRPALPAPRENAVAVQTLFPLPGWTLHVLPFDAALLRVRFNVSSPSGAIVIALAQPNLFSAHIGLQAIPQGIRTALFAGPAIRAFAVFGDAALQQVVAATTADAASLDARWELVEIVGMPVDETDWAAVFDHAQKQGLINQLTDPASAALDRWRRGAPFFGWDDLLAPGEPAMQWQLAEPEAMIKVARKDVLPDLRTMLTTLVPPQHITFQIQHTLPASSGANTASAAIRPLADLAYAAATDPLASLILGYGTAFDDVDLPPVILADRALLGDRTRSDHDFMVTALWGRGLDGRSTAVELAAIAPAPGLVTRPPQPANLLARLKGVRAPDVPDDAFRMTAEVEWAHPPKGAIARAVSYAAARRSLSAGITSPIIGPRKFDSGGALQTVGVSTSPERLNLGLGPTAGDDGHLITATPQPNPLRYAVAHQNLFGVWSAWSTAPLGVSEPAVQRVAIVSLRLETAAPAAGSVCSSRLVIDFSWDWASRRPLEIEFRGRFYVQATRDAAPSDLTVPAGLDRAFPGGGPTFTVGFAANGEVQGVAHVLHLSDDGTTILSAVDAAGAIVQQNPSTAAGPRRYRLTIDGMSIDHGVAGHVGMSVWARGRERAGIQRIGPFAANPKVVSSSDPRPPVIVGEREDVLLASLGDGKGEHRARIAWSAYPGAVGYSVYHAEESKIRTVNGMGDAPRSLTLSQRLAALRAAFQANPDKRAFARLNQTPISGLSYEATLPRGTKEIHLFVVVGLGAGGIESAWPTAADPACGRRPFAFAAPQIVRPSPPELEVARVAIDALAPPVHRARVIVRARPGVVSTRVDIHRVRNAEAALDLDTMGPAIAEITASSAQWTVTPHVGPRPGESQPLAVVAGVDPVPGSWKSVFYRAVAWSADDPQRGIYGGRSRPSTVQEVVVPPADPPDVTPLSTGWSGGPIGDVLAQATIVAPVAATVLGPHRLRVEALIEAADGTLSPAVVFPAAAASGAAVDDRLEAVATAPPAAGSAIWRTPRSGAEGCVLNIRVSRPLFSTPARVRVLVTDPLGRATERVADAPVTAPLAEPDIRDLTITPSPPTNRARLGFTTGVPPLVTPLGSYRLLIEFQTGPSIAFPPMPSIRRRLEVDLDKIRRMRPAEDLALDPADIPVRLVPSGGGRVGVVALLRGRSGAVVVTLTAPDGRAASERRRF